MEFYSDFWTIIESAISWTWDFMQRTLECCGWEGPSDWTNTTYGQIPCSCCVEEQVLNCRDDMKVDFGLALVELVSRDPEWTESYKISKHETVQYET